MREDFFFPLRGDSDIKKGIVLPHSVERKEEHSVRRILSKVSAKRLVMLSQMYGAAQDNRVYMVDWLWMIQTLSHLTD